MKNTNVIDLLISNLRHIVSANDDVVKNCENFTVLYNYNIAQRLFSKIAWDHVTHHATSWSKKFFFTNLKKL